MLNLLALKKAVDVLEAGGKVSVLIPQGERNIYKLLPLEIAMEGWKLIEEPEDAAEDEPEEEQPASDLSTAVNELLEKYNTAQAEGPAEEEPAKEEEPKSVKRDKRGGVNGNEKKITDLGKVKSLKEAGWSVHEIALEFHCTDNAVYKALAKIKAEGEKKNT